MKKIITLVVVIALCVAALIHAYIPYNQTQLEKVHREWAEKKLKNLGPRLRSRLSELEKAVVLTSDIEFTLDLSCYTAEDVGDVLFVWEDQIYEDHGGRSARPEFAYETPFKKFLDHFGQYELVKRISRELDQGGAADIVKQGRDALSLIDGLAGRYVVIGRIISFRHPDAEPRQLPTAEADFELFIVDTIPDEDRPPPVGFEDEYKRIISPDASIEVIAYGKRRDSPPVAMSKEYRLRRSKNESLEQYEERLLDAFATRVKEAIADEIETLTNSALSFDSTR